MNFHPSRTIRYLYLRLKRLQGDPESLALGMALGVFIGITPTIPLHTVLTIGLTLAFRASTLSGLIGTVLVSNPLTIVPLYYLCWKIGNWFMPDRVTWERLKTLLDHLMSQGLVEGVRTLSHLSLDVVLVLMSGGLVLAIPPSVISYFLARHLFLKWQLKRQRKHLLN
ncbi:DUF2062 domain-containing protein [Desulfolithobacter sp.]